MNKRETRKEYKPGQLWTPLLSQCCPVWGLFATCRAETNSCFPAHHLCGPPFSPGPQVVCALKMTVMEVLLFMEVLPQIHSHFNFFFH